MPGAVATSANVISKTAPALSNGGYDVSAAFPNGYLVLAPLAGGATLTLYGRGFGSNVTISVGEAQATNVTVTDIYSFPDPYETTKVAAVVHPVPRAGQMWS